MVRLDQLLHGRDNGFDALRMAAAVAVVCSHAYVVTLGEDAGWAHEPWHRFTHGQQSLGSLAVGVFFALSGLLLVHSARRHPNPLDYLVARAARVIPALLVVVPLAALVMGPLVSALTPGAYFASAETYLYLLNATALIYRDTLPGVFSQNPFPDLVNAPLWVLPYLVACYVLLLVARRAGVLRSARR